MVVILENSKKYFFTKKEGKFIFMPSALKEGVVKEFHQLEVGKPLSLTYFSCRIYDYKVDEENEMFLRTSSPIAEIKN